MTVAQLETFLAVWRHGSFSGAGEALFIPQPTLSNRIKLLELELGQELFVRHPKGVQLTEAGQVLLPYALEVVGKIAEARNRLVRLGEERELRIGSTFPMTDSTIFEPVIRLLSHSHAYKIGIYIFYMDSPRIIIDSLVAHKIDVSFTTCPINQEGLQCHHLKSEPLEWVWGAPLASEMATLMSAPDFARIREFSEKTPAIIYAPLASVIMANLEILHMRFGRLLVTNHIELTKYLIRQGRGMGILPPSLIGNLPETFHIALTRWFPDTLITPVQYYLTFRVKETRLRNEIRTFLSTHWAAGGNLTIGEALDSGPSARNNFQLESMQEATRLGDL
ncbi:MAG: LysR family transcriptional regulator [Acidithiobacillus sp.]|nr:LysR family transcriptional regulator [Acidithiobacillus sp.]